MHACQKTRVKRKGIKLVKDEVIVAAIQHMTTYGDFEGNIDAAFKLIDKCAKHEPDIVCLGVFWHIGNPVGQETPRVKEEKERAKEMVRKGEITYEEWRLRWLAGISETIPNGAISKKLAKKAKEHGIYLVGGSLIEKKDKSYFHTIPMFGPDGEFIGKQSKVILWDSYLWTYGTDLPVFETEVGRIGLCNCTEGYYIPEVPRILALKGADIIFVPSEIALTKQAAIGFAFVRAIENQVYMVYANTLTCGWPYKTPLYSTCIASPYKINQPILAFAGEKPGFIIAPLNIQKLREDRRRKVPVFSYPVTEDEHLALYEKGTISYPMIKYMLTYPEQVKVLADLYDSDMKLHKQYMEKCCE